MRTIGRQLTYLIAAAALLAACGKDETVLTTPQPHNTQIQKELSHSDPAVTTEMMVYLSEQAEVDQSVATKASGRFLDGEVTLERIFPDAGEWEPRHREAGLHRWFKVSFSSPISVAEAERLLSGTEGVIEVEQPVKVKSCAAGSFPFNDPYGREQWHYLNTGKLMSGFVEGCDINVVPVWEKYTGGSSDVIVAVVDDGIYYNHPDLKGVVIPGGKDGSRNMVRNSYEIVGGDHGSHVAGLIGAVNNNGTGCSSVAGGLDGKGGVRLLSCQIFEDNPDDPEHPLTGNIANAIVWGADHGAVICQNSWGYDYKTENQAKNSTISSSHKAAIDYFIKNAGIGADGRQTGPMKGGVVIFAAGNDGWQYGHPASYDKVIAVGATGPDARRASYSNYGSWVDICAPGGEDDRFPGSNGKSYILSLANTPYNYLYMCGTSMSCPLVSGVAALLVSEFGGEGFTNEDLKEVLLSTANKELIPASENIGGMVDAYAAFRVLADKPFFSTEYNGNYMIATGEKLSISYTVAEETATGGSYLISMDSDGSAELAVNGPDRCTVSFVSTEKNIGTHKAVLKAKSKTGKTGEHTIQYTIYRNEPPVITFSDMGGTSLMWHETLPVTITVTDPEGQPGVTTGINVSPESVCTVKPADKGYELIVGKGDGSYSGPCTVTVEARDIFGAESQASATYTIMENRAPVVVSEMKDIIMQTSGDKETIDMSKIFSEPDGEALKYKVEISDERVASTATSLNLLIVRASGEGYSDVTVTATDGLGKSCSGSFRVGVYNDSKGPTLFPNPVRDKLTVRTGKEDSVTLVMSDEMGREVLRKTEKAGIFAPMVLDLSALAPGRYPSEVSCGGKTYKKTIVKL